jgi:hypothetical protein
MVRRGDADEVPSVDVRVEEDGARNRAGKSSTERGLPNRSRTGDDQKRGAHEGALAGAMLAAQHVTYGRDQTGERASTATGVTCKRHTSIMSPRRPWTNVCEAPGRISAEQSHS